MSIDWRKRKTEPLEVEVSFLGAALLHISGPDECVGYTLYFRDGGKGFCTFRPYVNGLKWYVAPSDRGMLWVRDPDGLTTSLINELVLEADKSYNITIELGDHV